MEHKTDRKPRRPNRNVAVRPGSCSGSRDWPEDPALDGINVLFLSNGPSYREKVQQIRKGVHQSRSTFLMRRIKTIQEVQKIEEAIDQLRREHHQTVLITFGYQISQILPYLSPQDYAHHEIIIGDAICSEDRHRFPTSSLIQLPEVQKVQVVNDVCLALRKAIIKINVGKFAEVRQLQTEEDFERYLALRYQVWKEIGYLSEDNDSPESQWELAWTDRSSLPIGAFTQEGTLVGCARLVLGLGEEIPHTVSTIEQLLQKKKDPILFRNWANDPQWKHPFDVLEAFPKFPKYYRNLVLNKVSKAEVSRIIVHPRYRESGMGEALVDSVVDLARHYRKSILFLACRKEHESFYGRCGFHRIEGMECERFVNVGVPAIAMERHLPQLIGN